MKPSFSVLSREECNLIHQASLRVLEEVGVWVENEEALKTLKEVGADVDWKNRVVRFPPSIVEELIRKPPSTLKIHGREKKYDLSLGGDTTTFNPGSTATQILDLTTGDVRKPTPRDLADFVRLADALTNIHCQSTALTVDIPEQIADFYRLYVVLKISVKPVVTGAFTVEGLWRMKKLLDTVTGNGKLTAIFDVCPSPPLKWSGLASKNLLDCAKLGLPVEIIPMPQSGATSPATLTGTLVQHNAEFLSGLAICQAAKPGTPIIYGGSPSIFDMKHCTTPLSCIEAVMLTCAHTQLGKMYNLPTQAYLGLSDTKTVDAQTGLEAGIGLCLGILAGINVITGLGMLNFENCQSFEKLIIDHEICGIALKLAGGMEVNDETLALDVIRRVKPGGHYLNQKHTVKWFRREHFYPSPIIDRQNLRDWLKEGGKDILQRAKVEVRKILRKHKPQPLPPDIERELDKTLRNLLKACGMEGMLKNLMIMR